MEFVRQPPELSSEGPMDVNWRNWKQQFVTFLKVSNFSDDQPEFHKTSLLLNLIGPVGQQALEHFTFDSPSDNENMDIILKKFDEYYDPEKSEAHERNVFLTTKKKGNYSIDQYVNELRIKARACNFGDLTESLIRDKVVMEADRALKKLLLSEPNLDLKHTIHLWRTHDEMVKKVKQSGNFNKPVKNYVKAKGPGNRVTDMENTLSSSRTNYQAKKENDRCWRCGMRHAFGNCPAWGKKCENCNELGHFMKCCKQLPTAKDNSYVNVAMEMNSAQQQNFTTAQQQNFTTAPYRQTPEKVVNKDRTFKNTKKHNKSSTNSTPDCCIA